MKTEAKPSKEEGIDILESFTLTLMRKFGFKDLKEYAKTLKKI